jgi:hypothetical protein
VRCCPNAVPPSASHSILATLVVTASGLPRPLDDEAAAVGFLILSPVEGSRYVVIPKTCRGGWPGPGPT